MRERIETIPVTDAFSSGDECPFCYLEREVEQRVIRYVLGPGASYMEPDVRAATDEAGFCRMHYQKMHDYGNALGSALMMQTYYACMLEELQKQLKDFKMPDKRPLLNLGKQKPVDLPLLESRMTMNRIRFAVTALPHFDLLHAARRVYKLRIGRCNLAKLEAALFGVERKEDLPGALVPPY